MLLSRTTRASGSPVLCLYVRRLRSSRLISYLCPFRGCAHAPLKHYMYRIVPCLDVRRIRSSRFISYLCPFGGGARVHPLKHYMYRTSSANVTRWRDTKRSWTGTTEPGLACTRCPKLLNRVQGDFIQMHGLTPAAGYYQPYAQTVSVRDYGAGSSTHTGAAENVGISSRWKSSRCISCAFGGLTTNCMQARAETSVKCSDRIGPEFPPCLGGPYLNEGSSMRYFVPSILFGLTAQGRPS